MRTPETGGDPPREKRRVGTRESEEEWGCT